MTPIFTEWRRYLSRLWQPFRRRAARRAAPSYRPFLESLEYRVCPSVTSYTFDSSFWSGENKDQLGMAGGITVNFVITDLQPSDAPLNVSSAGGFSAVIQPGESDAFTWTTPAAGDTFSFDDGGAGDSYTVECTGPFGMTYNYSPPTAVLGQPFVVQMEPSSPFASFNSFGGDEGPSVADDTGTVTMSLAPNSRGATLSGTLTLPWPGAFPFSATFQDLTIDSAGQYTPIATSSDGVQVTLPPIDITPGLVFLQQPTPSSQPYVLKPFKVEVEQAVGVPDTSYVGNVTVALASNPTGADLSGPGNFPNYPVVNGVASIPSLGVSMPGQGYTLTASLSNGTTVTSYPFDVGPALAVISPPPNQVLPDQPFGLTVGVPTVNGVSLASSVTLALDNNPTGASFTPVTVPVHNAVATFTGLTLSDVGDGYTFQATATGVYPATTSPINVVAQVDSHTWTGLGKTDNWSDPDNWLEQTAPGPDQTLIFPAGAAKLDTIDDMPDLAVNEIDIGDSYTFRDVNGDTIDLLADITVTAGDTSWDFPITLGDPPVSPDIAAQAGPLAGHAVEPLDTKNINVDIAKGAVVKMQSALDGDFQLTLIGDGEFDILHATTYSGGTVLENGTLKINNANALGTGPLTVPLWATPTLDVANSLKLSNSVNLNGGTLNVAGQALTLAGTVTSNADFNNSEIDPAAKAGVILTGSLSGSLHVGGAGPVLLEGAVKSDGILTIDSGALVMFGSLLNGSGSVIVGGGTLASGSANDFKGTITLQAGQIQVTANNALGTATLFGPLTGQATLDPRGKAITLGNDLTLQGGTLKVAAGALTLSGTITVAQDSYIAFTDSNTRFNLQGSVGGSGKLGLDYSKFQGAVTLDLGTTDWQTVVDGKMWLKLSSDNSIANAIGSLNFYNIIKGNALNNVLTGGNKGNQLYGMGGADTLTGGAGNDFLDGGPPSSGSVLNGGPGYDFDAYQWGNPANSNSTLYSDIQQGEEGTCAFLAALSSADLAGQNLTGNIKYLGNGNYQVGLFNGRDIEEVKFDGTWDPHVDPQPAYYWHDKQNGYLNMDNATPEGGFWVILYQKAYLEFCKRGGPDRKPHDYHLALWAVTGRMPPEKPYAIQDSLFNLMASWLPGKCVVAGTKTDLPADVKGILEKEHAYTVVAVKGNVSNGTAQVVLRNPWGEAPDVSPNAATNGEFYVSWSQFKDGMAGVTAV